MNGLNLPIEQQFVEDDGPDLGTFEAAYDLAMMDTFVSGVARSGLDMLGIPGALDDLAKTTSKTLTPEEANELYPNVEKPFSQSINEAVAFQLNEEGKKRQLLQQKIAEGPGGSFYKGALNLGAGIIAHALDPVEFGVGAFTGMGISKLGQVAATGAFGQGAVRAGQIAAKGGFIKEAAEGVLGNLALEPLMYDQSQEAQIDYTFNDAFISVVGGGLAAPVAIHGFKKGLHSLRGVSKNAFGLGNKVAIGQFQNGKVPDVDLIPDQYKEMSLSNPKSPEGSVRSQYKFDKVDVDTVKQRPLYLSPTLADSIEDGSRVIGDYQGEGFYLTDNPTLANNMATHPLEDTTSNIIEMDAADLNLKDADIPDKAFLDSLEIDPGIANVIASVDNIRDAQNYIRSAIDEGVLDDTDFDTFMNAINTSGVDGLKFTSEEYGHNGVFVYKDSIVKAKEKGRFDADTQAAPTPDMEKVEQARLKSEDNVFEMDRSLQKELDDLPDPKDIAPEERAAIVDETLNTLDEMERLGLIDDPEDVAFLKSFKEDRKNSQDLLEAAKDFASCLLSGAD